VKFLILIFSFISLSSFACSDGKPENGIAAFITKESHLRSLDVSVYYPLKFGEAIAFRADISFGSNIDESMLSVPTNVTVPYQLTENPELKNYMVSTFLVEPSMLDKISITVYYKRQKRKGGLITFCAGPVAIYKINDLPIK